MCTLGCLSTPAFAPTDSSVRPYHFVAMWVVLRMAKSPLPLDNQER